MLCVPPYGRPIPSLALRALDLGKLSYLLKTANKLTGGQRVSSIASKRKAKNVKKKEATIYDSLCREEEKMRTFCLELSRLFLYTRRRLRNLRKPNFSNDIGDNREYFGVGGHFPSS